MSGQGRIDGAGSGDTVRVDLSIDVSEACGIPGCHELAASLFVPFVPLTDPLVMIVATPGGSLSRELFDVRLGAGDDFSLARDLASRGIVVVTLDHLGTGGSSKPEDGDLVDLSLMSQANAHAARDLRLRASSGCLNEMLPSSDVVMVGLGHSLGGFSTILQQGRYACYEAVCILGASLQFIAGVYEDSARGDLDVAGQREWVASIVRRHNPGFEEAYMRVDRTHHLQNHLWFTADTAPEVIAADPETTLPRQAAIDGMTPGFAAQDAAAIEVPVFLGFGDGDVSPSPAGEVPFYEHSPLITLCVLAHCAHIEMLSSARRQLFDELALFTLNCRGRAVWRSAQNGANVDDPSRARN